MGAINQQVMTPERRAFVHWLRVGIMLPSEAFADERKFNPYHDPRNGQFTFAPGGPRSLPGAVTVARKPTPFSRPAAGSPSTDGTTAATVRPTFNDGPVRLTSNPLSQTVNLRVPRRGGNRSNSRAFEDPMTEQPLFSSLLNSTAGALIAIPDRLFDITGPAQDATQALTEGYTRQLVAEIQAIDPNYRFDTFGTPATLQGQKNQIRQILLDRAGALYRIRGESAPLQAETFRALQAFTDAAFARGVALQQSG